MNNNTSKAIASVGVAVVCVAALHYGHEGVAVVIALIGLYNIWDN